MRYRHLIGGRFYIHSQLETHPRERGISGQVLVLVCHGYWNNRGATRVKGVQQCAFVGRSDQLITTYAVTVLINSIANNPIGHVPIVHTPTLVGSPVLNYTLTKSRGANDKLNWKGQKSFYFIDTSYVETIYPIDDPNYRKVDVMSLHNNWYNAFAGSQTVELSDVFDILVNECFGTYNYLYCCIDRILRL